jgi:hypothetical protein
VRAIRAGLFVAAGFALAAAAPPPEPPPLPEIVSSRIVESRFEPGDFEYLRGYFPDATGQEKADYSELSDWLIRCEAEGQGRIVAELAALGTTLVDEQISGAANLCRQVFRGEQFKQFASAAELEAAAREARLVFSTLVEVIRLSEQRIGPITPDFARELEARTLGEQLLRLSFNWTYGANTNSRLPQMSEPARAVFKALAMGELARVDFANTQWLKPHVVEKGWPKYSDVGEKAANAAWLLVQHADHDPAFQLQVLRLMEPMLATKEVSPGDYSYLYDRIMLKLTGKQRYATQFWCMDGKMQPRPLEQPDKVDELRAAMGLNPLEEYQQFFRPTC